MADIPCSANDYGETGLCKDCPNKDDCQLAKDGLESISESQ